MGVGTGGVDDGVGDGAGEVGVIVGVRVRVGVGVGVVPSQPSHGYSGHSGSKVISGFVIQPP